MKKTVFLELDPGEILNVYGNKPYYLAARSPLWITWRGSSDILLKGGESVLVPRGAGCVLAEGISNRESENGRKSDEYSTYRGGS